MDIEQKEDDSPIGQALRRAKHEDFCQNYVNNGFNASQAAKTAGYSSDEIAHGYASMGGYLMARTDIQERIAQLLAERWRSHKITADSLTCRVDEVADMAKDKGQYSIYLRAMEILGKFKGIVDSKGFKGSVVVTPENTTIEFEDGITRNNNDSKKI